MTITSTSSFIVLKIICLLFDKLNSTNKFFFINSKYVSNNYSKHKLIVSLEYALILEPLSVAVGINSS